MSVTAKSGFNLRPSLTTSFNSCLLDGKSEEQQLTMYQCLSDCFFDECCLAVNLMSCEKSYFPTEDMDFVKEVRV